MRDEGHLPGLFSEHRYLLLVRPLQLLATRPQGENGSSAPSRPFFFLHPHVVRRGWTTCRLHISTKNRTQCHGKTVQRKHTMEAS